MGGVLRKQESVQFCAGSPTLWGAAQMVFGVGGDRLVNGLGEIERFSQCKFKNCELADRLVKCGFVR